MNVTKSRDESRHANTETAHAIASVSVQERVATGMIALLLGVFLLYGAAFAHSDLLPMPPTMHAMPSQFPATDGRASP